MIEPEIGRLLFDRLGLRDHCVRSGADSLYILASDGTSLQLTDGGNVRICGASAQRLWRLIASPEFCPRATPAPCPEPAAAEPVFEGASSVIDLALPALRAARAGVRKLFGA